MINLNVVIHDFMRSVQLDARMINLDA